MTEPAPAPSAQTADRRYTLLPGRLRVEGDRASSEVALDDPSAFPFLALPSVDLDDGRPLRRAAFDAWSDHLRAVVAAGAEVEAPYRAPRPFATALAIAGAAFVSMLGAALLGRWATRPVAAVDVRPGVTESLAIVVAVLAVVAVMVLALSALVRAWRCRAGSYLHLSAYGFRTREGARAEPFHAIAGARWHGLLRCTRIAFTDGRPDLWLPAERGPLARADLVLAGLDDRLGDAFRSSL